MKTHAESKASILTHFLFARKQKLQK